MCKNISYEPGPLEINPTLNVNGDLSELSLYNISWKYIISASGWPIIIESHTMIFAQRPLILLSISIDSGTWAAMLKKKTNNHMRSAFAEKFPPTTRIKTYPTNAQTRNILSGTLIKYCVRNEHTFCQEKNLSLVESVIRNRKLHNSLRERMQTAKTRPNRPFVVTNRTRWAGSTRGEHKSDAPGYSRFAKNVLSIRCSTNPYKIVDHQNAAARHINLVANETRSRNPLASKYGWEPA